MLWCDWKSGGCSRCCGVTGRQEAVAGAVV